MFPPVYRREHELWIGSMGMPAGLDSTAREHTNQRHTFSARYFFFEEDFLPGTFAPLLRASDNPIAIACFLLVTFLPERPLLRVPLLRSCIARSTFSEAFLPYLAISLLSRCSGEILQAYSRPRLKLHATNQFPGPKHLVFWSCSCRKTNVVGRKTVTYKTKGPRQMRWLGDPSDTADREVRGEISVRHILFISLRKSRRSFR